MRAFWKVQGPGGGRAKGMTVFVVSPGRLGTKGRDTMPCSPSGPVKTVPAVLMCHSESSIGCGGRYRQPPKLSQGNSTTQGTASWPSALWATTTSFCTVLVQRHDCFRHQETPFFMFVPIAERSRGTGDGACVYGTEGI